jgi:hypothetical protein
MKTSIEIDALYAVQLQASAISLSQLLIWTIYDHPLDYPEWFVARPQIIRPKTSGPIPMHLMAKELNTLRALLPDGLVCLNRQPTDDPFILEVWV